MLVKAGRSRVVQGLRSHQMNTLYVLLQHTSEMKRKYRKYLYSHTKKTKPIFFLTFLPNNALSLDGQTCNEKKLVT
jgi:hypothetical protein